MPLSKSECATLESVRHNIDQMQLIMGHVRTYLDDMGMRGAPLNVAGIDRLATECHAWIDQLKGRFADKKTPPTR